MIVAVNVISLLSVAFLIVAICSAEKYIGCDSSDTLQDVINTEELEFDYSGNIKTFDDVNILSIVSTVNNDFEKVYIDATLEEDDYQTNLIIFTTDDFDDYVREQSSTKISLTIHFECTGGTERTLLFVQRIKDGNYFAPEFDKDSYVLVVPTPLFQGFELTMFGKITAVDYDLTGNDITFSSTNSELNLIIGLLEKREKTSFVSLKLRSTLFSFIEDIEFFITATDNGKPARSSSRTKVTITLDTSNSIPPVPTFTRAIVYGSLTEDLELNELELILKPETFSSDVSFKKLIDEDDIFELESSANVVHVSLAKQLDSEFLKEKEILTLVVEATNAKLKETGRTAVSVLLPRKQDHGFKEGLYTGKLIAKRNKLDIDGIEISTNPNDLDEIDFELEGQYKKSFDIMRRRNIIMLSLKSNVKPNVWANMTYVSLKLSAKLDSVEIASTNIIIDVVHTTLSFDKSIHIGSISSDGRLVLDPITLQSNEKTTDDVKIQLVPTDADVFLFDKTGNEIRLKLKKDVQTELENKTLFRIEVVAEQKVTGVRAVCVVLISRTLEKKEYRFKEGVYKGNLTAKRNRLDIDDFEIFTNTNEIENMDFELEGQFMELFEIKPNKNFITLSLKSSLKPNAWTNITYVALKLTAKIDLEEIASANIIIDVVHTTLWFEHPIFFGSITSDERLVLDPIKLQSNEKATDDVQIQLLQADADLFSFNKIGNEVRLSLKENFGNELENKTLTRLEVVAEEMSTGVRAVCVVLIERAIVQKVYRFKRGVYKGKLIAKANRIAIEDLDIFTNTEDLDDIDFELEGQFKESFQFDQHQNIITLSLKSNLKPSAWTNIAYVSLKLSAKLDSEEIASTNIIIDVVHTTLSFDKSMHFGSISSDDRLVLDPIKLQSSENNTDDVKIQLVPTDADIVSFEKTGNEIRLKLNTDAQTELENKTLFRLEVVAEEMLTGVRAVCVVLIERTIVGKEYRFKEGLHKGELVAKTNTLDIDDFEIVTNRKDLDEISFELEGQDKQSFEIKQHQTFITLSIKSDAPPNVWSNITYVALRLTAKMDLEDIASTNIIIDVIHTTLSFDQSIYFGSLSSDNKLVLDPLVLQSNEKTTDDVKIQLLQTDSELFSFDKIGNEIRLELMESIENEPENKTLFRLEVAAEEMVTGVRAVCVVLLERTIVEKEYRFKEGLYKGKLIAKTNNLDIADFEFFTNTKHLEDITFELGGAFNELFEFKRQHHVISLSLKPNLSGNVLANTTYVSLHLLAKLDSEEIASTILIIDVVHTTLWFDKSIYFGSISSNASLVLDPIQLQSNAEATDDVKIQLLQADAELFMFDKVGNEISLRLRENIASGLENKTMFRLEIEAEEMVTGVRAVCVVLFGKTVDGKVMKFGRNFYESEISNDPEFVFDIDLDKESYTEDTAMSISGQYADLFNIKQVENRLSLSLKGTFNLNDLNKVSYVWLEVKASSLMKKLEAWTVVVFRLVQDATPEFEQHAYIGTLTKSNVFELPTLVIKRSTWKASTVVEIIGNYSEYFASNLTENELRISLKSELPDDVKVRNSIVLVAIASNGHTRGFTTVVVNLPLSRSLSNIFKKIIQSGKIAHNETVQEMEMPDVEFVDEYNVADFNCTLTGDEVTYFDFSVVSPKNVIKLGLSSKIPEEIIQERLYLVISLECQHKANDLKAGSIILFLTLPGTSGCPPPDPVTYVPEFPKPFYNFYTKPSFVGSLQRVRAIIRESEDDIRYSLDISNEHLSSRLGIDGDTGEISITALISPGTYFFKIAAVNMVTQGQTKVNCRLDVEALIQCEDHAVVSNSLLTKYLKEETEYDDILNTAVGDCKFKIFAVTPNDQEYVYIDPVFNVLRMTPTDRENSIFANMTVPQIEVKLKLDCIEHKNATATSNLLRSVRELGSQSRVAPNESLGFTEDIAFAKDVTILSIILTDINDNHPVFVHPKHQRQVVGYPRDENLMDLFSECLIQVRATDKDQGLNKQIRYTIQPNRHFQIDAVTGKVYPLANAMSGINEIDVVVYATDRDGGSDGLSANFTLTVKVLTADHFLLLSFENRHIENVDALVESASAKTGLSLVLVRHATVSLVNGSVLANQRTLESGSDRFISKLWVYAFKDNVPVSSKVMKQLLSRSDNISAQSVKDVIGVGETVTQVLCSYDATGYICGLVILALLVVISIGFIFWKHIRSYIKSDEDASEDYFSSRGPANPNFQKKPKSAEMKGQQQRELAPDPSYYGRRDTTGTGLQDSRDVAQRNLNQNMNGSVYEMSYDSESQSTSGSSNESMRPRATVTFNELVQRIHIDDDVKIK